MIRAGNSSYSSVPHPFDTFPSFPSVFPHTLACGWLLQTLQLMGVAGRGSRSPRPPWRCRSSRGHPSTTYVPARCRRTVSSRDGSAHDPQTFQPKGDEITHQSSWIHAPSRISFRVGIIFTHMWLFPRDCRTWTCAESVWSKNCKCWWAQMINVSFNGSIESCQVLIKGNIRTVRRLVGGESSEKEWRQKSLLDGSIESPSANEMSEAEHLVLPALLFTARDSTSHHPDTILSSLLSFPSGVWTKSFLTIVALAPQIATMTLPGVVARKRTTWMKGECWVFFCCFFFILTAL